MRFASNPANLRRSYRINSPKNGNLESIDNKVVNRSDPLLAFGMVARCLLSNDLALVRVTGYAIALTELKLEIFLQTND